MKKSYIRKYNNNKNYVDLYATYKMYVLESKGINDFPERKDPFKEEWVDSNGVKIIENTTILFKPVKVKFKFAAIGDMSVIRTNFRSFWQELIRVVPLPSNLSIGSSIMEYYDDDMGSSKAKKIRLTSGSEDLVFVPEMVEDIQNLGTYTSAITFNMEFSIDKPDINSY